MSRRHRCSRPWFRRRRMNPHATAPGPGVPPPVDPDGRYAGRLVAALRRAGVVAEPLDTNGVWVTHPDTGRRGTVVLDHADCWGGLAWYCLRGTAVELIGPADAVRLVAGTIVNTIAAPQTRDRP